MNLPLKEQLKEWKKQHREIKDRRKKTKKRHSEVLTDADIKSLMGINRPTYARGKGGAYRQK